MSAVDYTDVIDTRKQHLKDTAKSIKEAMTPTLTSYKTSSRTVQGDQGGYQIPFFRDYYSGNGALSPDSTGNSFRQSTPPQTLSMWVGLAYMSKVLQIQGMLMNDLSSKQSIINEARLRELGIEDFMKHQNYYAIGTGTGVLAVTVTNTGGTFTGRTTVSGANAWGETKGAHRLRRNVTYDVIDPSNGTVMGTMTPTANGTGSATVTCTTTGSVNTAGYLVVEQGAYNRVPKGTGALISGVARMFQGVDTTNIYEFNSSSVDLNGSAVTSATVNTLKTKVQIRKNDPNTKFKQIGHLPQGLYNTLAIQGFGARQYQAADGQATTSYGYPGTYVDGDTVWIKDADFDEDKIALRNADDFFMFEARPFGLVNEDGLTKRQPPGYNDVGAWEYFEQYLWVYNLGFDGDATGGNYGSAYIQRAAINNAQVGA
jgi:hypothetical protein